MIRRTARLFVPAILLSVPLGLSGTLAWQVVHLASGGAAARAAGITPQHSGAVLLRGAPRVLAITTTPAQLAPLETVTIAAALYAGGTGTRPYTATVQLLPADGGPTRTATQGGITLHPRQQETVYWEWRAGASLPTGVYTVRVLLRGTAQPGGVVASATAGQTVTVAPR
jgi:hypothetical protein